MKKISVFIFILMSFIHIEASFLHKMLRAAVPLVAVAGTGFELKNAYDANNAQNKSIADDVSLKLFGEETQTALREYYKTIYTSEKPLSFGVANQEFNAFAVNQAGVNYIFFGYGFLPKVNLSKPPKPIENESEEDFELRCEDFLKIRKEERKQSKEWLHNPPMKEFKEKLETITAVAKHEMGHLAYEHPQQQANNRAKLSTEMGILSAFLNGYLVKSSFAKNITEVGLVGKIGASISFALLTRMYSLYKQNELARLYECEADDFAIKNAVSKEELIQYKILFEEELKRQVGIKVSLFHQFYHTYMSTHPSPPSRIEKVQKAIDNWQK